MWMFLCNDLSSSSSADIRCGHSDPHPAQEHIFSADREERHCSKKQPHPEYTPHSRATRTSHQRLPARTGEYRGRTYPRSKSHPLWYRTVKASEIGAGNALEQTPAAVIVTTEPVPSCALIGGALLSGVPKKVTAHFKHMWRSSRRQLASFLSPASRANRRQQQ